MSHPIYTEEELQAKCRRARLIENLKHFLAGAITVLSFVGMCLFFYVSSSPAHAEDEWDTTDKTLGATALVVTLIDMGQTMSISKACHSSSPQYYETNSMLGTCPSAGRVRGYFATAILLSGTIAELLPSKYRKDFLTASAAIEFQAAYHNYSVGISWSWK